MKLRHIALMCWVQGAAFAQDAPDKGPARPDPVVGQARFEALLVQIQEFQQRHSITVHGADNAAGVPRGALLSTYFARFRRVEDGAFSQFALEEVGATGPDVDVLREARNVAPARPSGDACAPLLDGSLSNAGGLDIANYILAAEAERDREVAVRYQVVLDRLSTRVKANALRDIDAVSRLFVSTNLDHLGMARENPDLYKTMTTGFCRGQRNAARTNPDVGRNGDITTAR